MERGGSALVSTKKWRLLERVVGKHSVGKGGGQEEPCVSVTACDETRKAQGSGLRAQSSERRAQRLSLSWY